jgi:hypothetical protein
MILTLASDEKVSYKLQNFQYLEADRTKVTGILAFEMGSEPDLKDIPTGDYFLSVNGQPKFTFLENLSISRPESTLSHVWEAKIMINYLTPGL